MAGYQVRSVLVIIITYSVTGSELLFLESGGCLTVLDVPEDKSSVLVDSSVLVSISIPDTVLSITSESLQRQYHHTDQYLLSPDRRYLLLHHHTGYTVISLHNQKGSVELTLSLLLIEIFFCQLHLGCLPACCTLSPCAAGTVEPQR